ncbi:MAG: maleylpyruvate isomerase family mycothiol-dependent enzyme [Jatrophihabitans sp.]
MTRDPLRVGPLVAERNRFVDTIETLTDDEFEHGSTLCSEWSPRDVLAHLVTTGDMRAYVRNAGRIDKTNSELVDSLRRLDRAALTARGRRWAVAPGGVDRAAARFLIGDVAVHHQDVLRGLGRRRELPAGIAAAILREGITLSSFTGNVLWRNRVDPTDGEHRAVGRGRLVRGCTEALGLWLGGRYGLEAELEFA